MKSFLTIVSALIVSTTLQAAPSTTPPQHAKVELGKYRAVDAETRSIFANFELKANGTVDFKVQSPETDGPIYCQGRYSVKGNKFFADLACDSFFLSEASVQIDITNVNPVSLRSENGVAVAVIIDALGSDPNTFLLKKDEPKK